MGPINLGRAAGAHLSVDGGLIFLSGAAAYRQAVAASIVGAVNMALESFAAATAIELRPRRVSVISSSVVDTPSWAGMAEDGCEGVTA